MSGKLPGVKCARRRRIHHAGDSLAGSRPLSFCLYAGGHHIRLHNNNNNIAAGITKWRRATAASNGSGQSMDLGAAAREAKERLDGRLRAQRLPAAAAAEDGIRGGGSAPAMMLGVKWKSLPPPPPRSSGDLQVLDECAVCLEELRRGEVLVRLPCSHRFHWGCVVPWLETSHRCPCCRTAVSSFSSILKPPPPLLTS